MADTGTMAVLRAKYRRSVTVAAIVGLVVQLVTFALHAPAFALLSKGGLAQNRGLVVICTATGMQVVAVSPDLAPVDGSTGGDPTLQCSFCLVASSGCGLSSPAQSETAVLIGSAIRFADYRDRVTDRSPRVRQGRDPPHAPAI